MGLAASSGCDNDELIDKLIDGGCISKPQVEKAMRLVDRALFFPKEQRNIAYRDLAWKSDHGLPGHLHISAPCIYANVLECLELGAKLSFLNIGSGTGYLNTVVGFLIGSSGKNHGIEIHSNIVEYAQKKLLEVMRLPEVLCFDWGMPEYVVGNGLLLDLANNGQYDRVYCGAAVPRSHRRSLWELIKVGGILVMPYNDVLVKVRRKTLERYEVTDISSVSFADFILPSSNEVASGKYSNTPAPTVPSLEWLCAMCIRQSLRNNLIAKRPVFIRHHLSTIPQNQRYVPSFVRQAREVVLDDEEDIFNAREEFVADDRDVLQPDHNNSSDDDSDVDFAFQRDEDFNQFVLDENAEIEMHIREDEISDDDNEDVGEPEPNGQWNESINIQSDSEDDEKLGGMLNLSGSVERLPNSSGSIERSPDGANGSNSKKRSCDTNDGETSAKRRVCAAAAIGEEAIGDSNETSKLEGVLDCLHNTSDSSSGNDSGSSSSTRLTNGNNNGRQHAVIAVINSSRSVDIEAPNDGAAVPLVVGDEGLLSNANGVNEGDANESGVEADDDDDGASATSSDSSLRANRNNRAEQANHNDIEQRLCNIILEIARNGDHARNQRHRSRVVRATREPEREDQDRHTISEDPVNHRLMLLEEERQRERNRQMASILRFGFEFDNLLSELLLNNSLCDYIKYLC